VKLRDAGSLQNSQRYGGSPGTTIAVAAEDLDMSAIALPLQLGLSHAPPNNSWMTVRTAEPVKRTTRNSSQCQQRRSL
jgi:hypothetical protein